MLTTHILTNMKVSFKLKENNLSNNRIIDNFVYVGCVVKLYDIELEMTTLERAGVTRYKRWLKISFGGLCNKEMTCRFYNTKSR